jgi:hypothetical protein
LVVNRFSQKAMSILQQSQELGSVSKTKKKRAPKDFEALYQDARHICADGDWDGVAAPAFRNGSISACRVADFTMTRAKLALFVVADGHDQDGMPIVRIHADQPPEMWICPTRNANGSFDLRARPRWRPGWWIWLNIDYDAGVFSAEDVVNLIHRVGCQVGIGEGRPDSKDSCGLGLGLFRIVEIEVGMKEAA